MTLAISSEFDSGNIEVLRLDGGQAIELAIRPDASSKFYQWFHFRVTGAAGRALTMRIVNCAGSAYPQGWPGFRARVSEDRRTWRQATTDYSDGVLTIRVTPATDSLWVAYHAPYSMERHHDLIAGMATRPGVTTVKLGETLDGQDLDMVRVGDGTAQVWITCRQHPGETMAEWWAEGALEALTDPFDPVSRALRRRATLHIVPNMNPDGSRRGHLRTNAAGMNLNREWYAPSLSKSPEVYLTLQAMRATGVDLALDVHGDEVIPHVFIAGFEGIPSLKPKQAEGYAVFRSALAKASPDFQVVHGYPTPAPGRANLSMSTNAVAEMFGAVAATLEMPFHDTTDLPDPVHGWSPARSKALARACLTAMLETLGR